MVALNEHEMVKWRVSSFLLGMNDVVMCVQSVHGGCNGNMERWI